MTEAGRTDSGLRKRNRKVCECVWQQLSDKSDKERVRAPFLSSSRLLRFSGFYVDAALCVWVCETDCVTCLRRIFSDIEQQNGFPSEGSSGYLHQEPSGRFWDPAESRRRNLRGGLQGQLLCTAATCTCSLKSGLFKPYLYFKKPFRRSWVSLNCLRWKKWKM